MLGNRQQDLAPLFCGIPDQMHKPGCRYRRGSSHGVGSYIQQLEVPGPGEQLQQFGYKDEGQDSRDLDKHTRIRLVLFPVFPAEGEGEYKEEGHMHELVYAGR